MRIRADILALATVLFVVASCTTPDLTAPRSNRLGYIASTVPHEPDRSSSDRLQLPYAIVGLFADTVVTFNRKKLGKTTDPSLEKALNCLTEAVYFEARSEPKDGQRAVAQVIVNRAREGRFGSGICGVVNHRTAAGNCDFSYRCGEPGRRREPVAWEKASKIASEAMSGRLCQKAQGATFYHNESVSPDWASRLIVVAHIGKHIFYKDRA